MSNNSNSSRGVGLLGVLQIIFIVLKLCDLIKWSWLVVLIPLWISIGCTLVCLLILLGVNLWERKN